MIEIDGSFGEGGGQILRTSLSLSAVTHEPVRVYNIRAGRPNPGLAPQHLTSIESVARLCDARVDGLSVGSKEISFTPGQLVGGDFEFDVGTAGSISLVLQSCILPAAMARAGVRLTVKGGTDVKWSPPIDYLGLVHIPMISKFGIACELGIASRGFYPEGGGEVRATVTPCHQLRGLDLAERGEVEGIAGVAYAQNLPEHVVARMKHAALKKLVGLRNVKVESDLREGRSTGAGIVLAASCGNTVLGESALGERGVRAEQLGDRCALDLTETVRSGATVDEHMLDQIIPYMALAEGPSKVVVEEVTRHAETNMWVVEKFTGRPFTRTIRNSLVEISSA